MNNHEIFVEFTKLILNSYKNKNQKYADTTMREHLINNFLDMPVFDMTEVFHKKGTIIEEMAKEVRELEKVTNSPRESEEDLMRRLHGEAYNVAITGYAGNTTIHTDFTPYVDSFMVIVGNEDYHIASIVVPSKLEDTHIMYTCAIVDKIESVIVSSLKSDENSTNIKVKSVRDDKFKRLLQGVADNMILLILTTFRDLQVQKDKPNEYVCYEDVPTEPQTAYLRKNNKEAVKVSEKPVIVILKNEDDEIKMEKTLKKYERSGHTLQYSFSWVVRGHWRALHNHLSFGKDKNGNPVQGKTWVKTHLKGNVDMPIRRREIIVKDRRTA